MAGGWLSVIVLCDARRDAGRGAATAPLISPTSAGLQGEERRGKEGGERRRGKGKRQERWEEKKNREQERGKVMIFMNPTKAIYL